MLGSSEKVPDLLPHIRAGGAYIDGGVRWGLLHLRLHRCQMSLQIYAWRFGEVCSEPNERLLIVVEGSHVGYGCSRRSTGPIRTGTGSIRGTWATSVRTPAGTLRKASIT